MFSVGEVNFKVNSKVNFGKPEFNGKLKQK